MELRRNQDQEDGTAMPVSLGYTPPTIRVSAFSKPLLPTSSSLVSPRVGGTTTMTSNAMNSAAIDHPLRSQAFDQDPFHIPISSPPWVGITGGGSFAGHNSKTEAATTSSSSIPAETEANYHECLRNHAAGVGGHVLDGCGEFMPGGDAGTPDALKCAACGCHRSFHRKESDADHHGFSNSSSPHQRVRIPFLIPPSSHHRSQQQQQPNPVTPPSPLPGLPPFGVNYGGGATTPSSSSEEQAMTPKRVMPGGSSSRKRFRTKFTTEQKERMQDFAEKVGWRIQKQDGALVERFCAEVGVKRQVLRVWMHNNKHTRNQPQNQQLEGRMMTSSPIPNTSPSS